MSEPTHRSAGTGPGRRLVLRAAAAGGVTGLVAGAPSSAAAAPPSPPLRVYVLVVDGCRPDEFGGQTQPRLAELRRQGTWYSAARSLPVMETIPNHVMMATGVRPDRSGVPANSVYDRTERSVRDLDRPSDLKAATFLERLPGRGFTTATVLSKEYLVGIFGTRATHRWVPPVYLPGTNHAPDVLTVDALIDVVDTHDPDVVFTNLGDIDRFGHVDPTGTSVRAARTAALVSTDLQVGRFVDHLKSTGKWASSVLVVLADHSMDWSLPTNLVSIQQQALATRPDLQAGLTIAQNGGADLLYWTGSPGVRTAALADIRRLVTAHPGVLSVKLPKDLRLGPDAGDLVAYCRPGWRFSDPQLLSNPIPGNHGHPATEPIPLLITGGHPRLRRGRVSTVPAATIDVAPTIGALFRLPAPRGGYDGTVRLEALASPLPAPSPR